MKIASEMRLKPQPWWRLETIGPKERKMKKAEGLRERYLPDKETVLAEKGLSPREPIRFILWLEIAYTERGEQKKEPLLCALEPDGSWLGRLGRHELPVVRRRRPAPVSDFLWGVSNFLWGYGVHH